MAMTGICTDRLLKQRSALRKQNILIDLPPQRGGLRSLSAGRFALRRRFRVNAAL
jgi:hypothetical protein